LNILGIDLGTTAIKAVVFGPKGDIIASAVREHQLFTPQPHVVELEPDTYWDAFCSALRELFGSGKAVPASVRALAISSQGETLIPVDEGGKPLRRAIVWLDDRAGGEAKEIEAKFTARRSYEVTGQPDIVPGWPAPKILWLGKNEPEVFRRTRKFLLLADWFIQRLTGIACTDVSLSSSSLMMDIRKKVWWGEMLAFLGIGPEKLPELRESGVIAGPVTAAAAKETGLAPETTVVTGAMDQVAGMVGAGNIRPGIVSETTGGALALCVTLDEPRTDAVHRLPCQCHAVPGKYLLLPWCQTGGMMLRWFRDAFSCGSYDDMTAEAARVPPGSGGVVVLPHLAGAGSPEFDPAARGVFSGISLQTGRPHFIRAILESVAFMLKRNLEVLEGMGLAVGEIRSLGGGARSPLWNQIKADVTGKPIVTMKHDEAACLGAAILAGTATGIFPSIETAVETMSTPGKTYAPAPANLQVYGECYAKYIALSGKLKGAGHEPGPDGGPGKRGAP